MLQLISGGPMRTNVLAKVILIGQATNFTDVKTKCETHWFDGHFYVQQ